MESTASIIDTLQSLYEILTAEIWNRIRQVNKAYRMKEIKAFNITLFYVVC